MITILTLIFLYFFKIDFLYLQIFNVLFYILMSMKINMKYIQILTITIKSLIIFLNQNQNLKK